MIDHLVQTNGEESDSAVITIADTGTTDVTFLRERERDRERTFFVWLGGQQWGFNLVPHIY
jgi:predicted nucleotidyltransferase